MDGLRSEIVESQKVRSDLFKWKLGLVAGLGGVGIGLGVEDGAGVVPNIHYVLLLIPAVCLYVDLVCQHMNLRMLVIGQFLEHCSGSGLDGDRWYERFVRRVAQIGHWELQPAPETNLSAYDFERYALEYSSRALCVLLVIYGIGQWAQESLLSYAFLFVLAGVAGFGLSLWVRQRYLCLVATIDYLADSYLGGQGRG